MLASLWLMQVESLEVTMLAVRALEWAVRTGVGTATVLDVVGFSIHHLRPANPESGGIIARSRVLHTGRRVTLAEVLVEDGSGRGVAHGTGSVTTHPMADPPPEHPLRPVEEPRYATPDPYLRPAPAPISGARSLGFVGRRIRFSDHRLTISADGVAVELKVTRYEIDEAGVATVWLHRPERGNAWTGRMHTEYRWICQRLEDDPAVRVIVLTGSGDRFCVGADRQALAGYVEADHYDPALAADAERPGYGVRPEFDADMTWQLGLRVPMIAAVNGACAGIAVALAAFCDLRFAVEGAKVTTATARLGLPAEYGLSWILPRLIGPAHAADVLLTGRILWAEELGAMGFFNAVLPRPEFARRVAEYAAMLAAASPEAVSTAKRQLWGDLLHGDPRAAVEESKALIGKLMQHPDYAEGVAALLEKRPPRFIR